MRTIQEVFEILVELDKAYGVKTSHAQILHNKRLSKSLGRCHYKGNTITKFDFSTLALNLDYETFKHIVMHEWAHAYNKIVHNGSGHDATFKQTCAMIGCKYDGTKCYDNDALELAKSKMPTLYKYQISCNSCGLETKLKRKNQAYQVIKGEMFSIGSYCCGVCKSKDLIAKEL